MKTCKICNLVKDYSEFDTYSRSYAGFAHSCTICKHNKSSEAYKKRLNKDDNPEDAKPRKEHWGVRNPEKHKVQRDEWSKNNKERQYFKQIYTRLKISKMNYLLLFSLQQKKCKICGIAQDQLKRRLSVDHCHKTGIIRGLLCGSCNQGLGNFLDSPELLHSAIAYLANYDGITDGNENSRIINKDHKQLKSQG